MKSKLLVVGLLCMSVKAQAFLGDASLPVQINVATNTVSHVTVDNPTVVAPVGVQANAWNNVAVVSNSTSAVVDTQYVNVVTVFGNTSANVNPLRIQASQDNTNFYTVATLSISTGNWGTTLQWSARYMRLQSGGIATITATIAGKD